MNDKLKSAYSKLFNSDLVKDVYPMVDHIDIVRVNKNPLYQEYDTRYDMLINIFLNDPEIDNHNMYRMKFDPHYLVDKHLPQLLKYMGIEINQINFRLYSSNGELLLDWS